MANELSKGNVYLSFLRMLNQIQNKRKEEIHQESLGGLITIYNIFSKS